MFAVALIESVSLGFAVLDLKGRTRILSGRAGGVTRIG